MIVNQFNNSDNLAHVSPFILNILESVTARDLASIPADQYSLDDLPLSDAYFVVMDYQTCAESSFGPEFHQLYTDVQFILSGEERCGWAILSDPQKVELLERYDYNAERDICFIDQAEVPLNDLIMRPGEFYILPPNTLHMPNLNVHSAAKVRKVVIKIKTALLAR